MASPSAIAVYKRRPFQDMDRLGLIIFLILGALELSIIFYGSQLEIPEMTAEKRREFFSRRFDSIEVIPPPAIVQEETQADLTIPSDLEDTEPVVDEPVEVLDRPVERQQTTAEKRQARRDAAASMRASRREAISQDLVDNTGGIALIGGKGESVSSIIGAAKVSSKSSISTEGLTGVVTGQAAENVRKLRKGKATGKSSSGVDIEGALAGADAAVEGGTIGDIVVGSVDTYDRTGKFSKEAARSPKAIMAIMDQYYFGIKDCITSARGRSKGLVGSVLVNFSINADGSVSDIRFTRNNWSDSRGGRKVESCMKRKISQWKFDPVDESLGTLKTGRTYTFN
jgi:hypothetical protein